MTNDRILGRAARALQARSLEAVQSTLKVDIHVIQRGWVACSRNTQNIYGHEARQLKVDIAASRHSPTELH